MKSPTALIILDGFGHGPESSCNAITQAKKPTLEYLLANYPHTLLAASGKAVGLPEGYKGNSEVGHCTIGTGRVIPSPCLRLLTAISNGEFFSNPILVQNLDLLASTGKTLHILGILSDAGSQGHEEIIHACVKAAADHRVKRIIVHPFLDGRDVPPKSAPLFLATLDALKRRRYPHMKIGSITGRYYAMDRDKEWGLTQDTYAMLTEAREPQFATWQEALSYYYAHTITDEFIPPTRLDTYAIMPNDGIIFTNFREDRARQLAACFLMPADLPIPIKPLPLVFCISATRYDAQFNNPVLLTVTPVKNTLKEVLARAGKTVVAIAETEKYAHITYFFSDGREKPFPRETQILIPSLDLKSYAEQPAMSAPAITAAVLKSLKTNPAEFYLINYANADMVGHSGNLKATIKAIECLDAQIKELYEWVVKKMNGTIYITADHGNAELKCDAKGNIYTGHTTNPVPFIWVNNDRYRKKIDLPLHTLSDIAPFILKHMEIQIPQEMQ